MIFYIYLVISLLTAVLLMLMNISTLHTIKEKYKDQLPSGYKTDVAGNTSAYIKIIILGFIPIYNMFMLLMLIFKSNIFFDRAEEMIKEKLRLRKENEDSK